jgi:hypothetical protein
MAYNLLLMAYCLLAISDLLQSSQVGFMDMLTVVAVNTKSMTCGIHMYPQSNMRRPHTIACVAVCLWPIACGI